MQDMQRFCLDSENTLYVWQLSCYNVKLMQYGIMKI